MARLSLRPGTEEHAKQWRLFATVLVRRIEANPKHVARYLKEGVELRVWKLLRNREGATFASLEELCATPKPFGLGRPLTDIRSALVSILGEPGFELVESSSASSERLVASDHEPHGPSTRDRAFSQDIAEGMLRVAAPTDTEGKNIVLVPVADLCALIEERRTGTLRIALDFRVPGGMCAEFAWLPRVATKKDEAVP